MAKKLTIDIQTQIEASVANNLTTTDAGKVLDARQGKALDDKKLDKVTTTTAFVQLYAKTTDGNQAVVNFGTGAIDNGAVQRKANGIFRLKDGNTASRPTTNLNNGDQYFNTTTNQMEIYIGDANHWLYQKYSNGDTLPTPAVGTSHTYLVVGNGVATDEGATFLNINGKTVYASGYSSTVIISNAGGTLFFANGSEHDTLANLTIDDADYLSLLRVA
jgi:hypothetical protein